MEENQILEKSSAVKPKAEQSDIARSCTQLKNVCFNSFLFEYFKFFWELISQVFDQFSVAFRHLYIDETL